MTRQQKLVESLVEIRRRAMDHPLFDETAFAARDLDELAKTGGDICDWTTIAILADDALKTEEKNKA